MKKALPRQYNPYHRDYRRPYRREGRGEHFRKPRALKPQYPMPLGVQCNPLCPFFVCTKRAKVIVNKSYRGKIKKVAYCRLTGSECIGAECKYATCRINSMLPDGKCAKALEKTRKEVSDEELFREMEEIEDYDIDEFR